MKTIPRLLSILIILSIWFSLVAPNVVALGYTKFIPTGDLTEKANQAILGNTGSSSGSSNTPSGSSDTSNNGKTGSDHQMGSANWQTGSTWPIPVTTYPSTNQISGINLWIDAYQGHMQYAVVPQYSSISLIASTQLGGQGTVYELYPITTGQGAYTTNTYSFNPGNNQLGFVANIVGRHILLFSINNQASNAVIVDVQGGINSLQQRNWGLLGQGV